MRLKTLAAASLAALALAVVGAGSAGAEDVTVTPWPGLPPNATAVAEAPYESLAPKHNTDPSRAPQQGDTVSSGRAGASGYWKSCTPRFEGQPSILAHGTSCGQASAVIQKVYVKGQEVRPTTIVHAKGWTCELTGRSPRGITCKRGSRVIKAATPG